MLLKEMCEIYSPTGSEDALVDFLIKWANTNGYKAEKDEIGNFIATKGNGKEILLVGHVDTVTGEIPVEIKDNKLFGRGAVDAKGPLSCFLEASLEIRTGKIVIIGAVDEEGDSKGAKNVLNKYDPKFIIVGEPSGWENITIGYKGRLKISYNIKKEKEHTSSIALNCYEDAVEFYNKIMEFSENFNQEKSLFKQIGIKILSIISEDDDFIDNVKLQISLRTPIGFCLKEFKKYIQNIKKNGVVVFSDYEEPVKVNKDNLLVSCFKNMIRKSGGKPTYKLKAGTSDMNILQKYNVPMITYGPGDSTLDHTPNECIDLDEYFKSVDILKNVLEKLTLV